MSIPPHDDFEIIASSTFVGFPDGKIFSLCPTMDLFAVSMNKTSIWVFRVNGERVYSINNRCEVLHLVWNHSGKFFAVSGTDNFVKVYDSNNGALVNTFTTSTTLPITLTNWCSVNISASSKSFKSEYLQFFKVNTFKNMPKLANELDTKVAETKTPSSIKIQPVTSTNEDESLLDCLIVVNSNALMSITFDNLFTVPDIELPENWKILTHGVVDDLFCHTLLIEDHNGRLRLTDLQLEVVGSSERMHVITIIRWSAMLVSLTNHINEQFQSIMKEAQEFISLFDRHFGNLKDSLYADVDLTTNFPHPQEVEQKIIDSFMYMLLSGLIPVDLKDFWLNQFGERGLVKVSTVGNGAFDNARKALFTQIILAIEKLILILSDLEGVINAEISVNSESFGISVEAIARAIKLSQLLIKKFYEFIWKLNDNLEGFNKTLNWLKVEVIGKLSKEDSDPLSFFSLHSTMDFKASEIIDYIETGLLAPAFLEYLPIETSNNEVLVRDKNDSDLEESINDLLELINGEVLKGLQNNLIEKVNFEEYVTLTTEPGQSDCRLRLFDTISIVTCIKDVRLTLIRVEGGNQDKMELDFPGEIFAHEVIDKNKVLILYLDSELNYKLSLHQFGFETKEAHSVRHMTFDNTSFVKKPTYMSISGVQEESRILGYVLDATKKQYVVFKL